MYEGAPNRKVYIEEIFKRILRGEKDAFRDLYERSYKPLYAFLLSLTQNAEDAQDLLQDTYIQIYKKCSYYREQGNPMAWMMKIARNLFLMKYRREKSAMQVNYEAAEYELGFSDISNVDNRMVLEKMFALLSEEERNVIILHDVSGLKHREIAEILHIPLGTVLAKYNRSIRRLQREFQEEEHHEKK